MRVLAIRASNLASLLELEVNFDKQPLDQTRILAITGPTGSGKSTVLDAMCLALYDKVPRLLQARDLPGGQDEILGNDPRGLMRRGAAEAWAEVDFVGADKYIYRSRWELRRARKKADGKIQSQKIKLYQLPEDSPDNPVELTGATRTETLSFIKDKIGLGFSEFRRAVLLAQGDFATFLKARSTERATLLEKMTGTELYAHISQAAHIRAKEERNNLAQLKNSIDILEVLPEQTIKELIDKKAAISKQRTAEQEQLNKVRETIVWYQTEQSLKNDLFEAQKEQQLASEDLTRGKDIHARIRVLEYAQQLQKPAEKTHF